MNIDRLYVATTCGMSAEASYGLSLLCSSAGICYGVEHISVEQIKSLPELSLIIAYLDPNSVDLGALRPDILIVPATSSAPGPILPEEFLANLPFSDKQQSVFIPSSTKCIHPQDKRIFDFDIFIATFEYAAGNAERRIARAPLIPGTSAASWQHMPFERPVIDEYSDMFRTAAICLAYMHDIPMPTLATSPAGSDYTFLIALDFDTYGKGPLEIAKQLFGLKSRIRNINSSNGIGAALREGGSQIINLLRSGPYDGIPKVRDWLESRNLRGSFNIYVPYTSEKLESFTWRVRRYVYDPNYDVRKIPGYTAMLRDMHASGHEIGIQYAAFSSVGGESDIAAQSRTFEELFGHKPITGRHHFLGQVTDNFFHLLKNANIALDTSPGFLDKSGFRFGSTRPMPGFDFIEHNTTNVISVPTPLWDGVLSNGTFPNWESQQHEIERVLSVVKTHRGVVASGIHPRSLGAKDYYRDHWRTFEFSLATAQAHGAHITTCQQFLSWWRQRAVTTCEAVLEAGSWKLQWRTSQQVSPPLTASVFWRHKKQDFSLNPSDWHKESDGTATKSMALG